MTNIIFILPDGTETTIDAPEGASILQAAWDNKIDIEGACEGCMACSTCHVLIAREWLDKLPAPVVEEEDMLDLAAGARANSRLACQIVLAEDLNGLEVTIPPDAHDMSSIR